jgi:CelD/BcsL family acetyltransferase involved in cellulose biosynthesis
MERGPRDHLEWFVAADERALERLTPDWRELARSVASPTIFGSPDWVWAWWQHFGANRRLHVAGARRGGRLVALAPLCTRHGIGLRVRHFLGAEEADVGSFLLAPGAESLAPGLARVALGQDGWDICDLWCVPAGSVTARALETILADREVAHELTPLTVNPVVNVRDDQWTRGASRSMLKNLRRQRRVLAREGKLRLVMPTDTDEVEAALDDLRAHHAERWHRRGELSLLQIPRYWAWVRGVTLAAHAGGWLYLRRLTLDDRLVATGIFFLYERRLFFWLAAHDPAFARHAPDMLLTLAVIEDVRGADSADLLDFGQGDEWYKLRWTRDALPLQRVMAWHGLIGRGGHLWHGRLRPWGWAHPGLTRPLRRWKRAVRRALAGVAA